MTITTKCVLTEIFKGQQNLIDQFGHIEEDSGLLCHPLQPVDLHDRFGQGLLRDVAWRITEELTEATNQIQEDGGISLAVKEEFIDCLHFMVEMLILSGISPLSLSRKLGVPKGEGILETIYEPKKLSNSFKSRQLLNPTNNIYVFNSQSYKLIQNLGISINTLKNKAWKKEHRLTDINKFNHYMVNAFLIMMDIFILLGMSPEDIHQAYFHKKDINQERIDQGV